MEIEITLDQTDIKNCLQNPFLSENAYSNAIEMLLKYYKEGNSISDSILEEIYSGDTPITQKNLLLKLTNEMLKVTAKDVNVFINPFSFHINNLTLYLM